MKKEELFDIIGEVDEEKVKAAGQSLSKKKHSHKIWIKWGALAACICIVIVSVISILPKRQPLTVTLSNGEEITFSTNGSLYANNIAISIAERRPLTETEASVVFGTSQIDASVTFEEGTYEFIILGGTIDDFDIEVRRKDIPSCVIIEGEENTSYINDVAVTAGYFITDTNSKGEKTAIVYGSFVVGNYTVSLETVGADSELENLCNALAEEILKLIENAGFDFEQIKY